jgi:hypothetical protein
MVSTQERGLLHQQQQQQQQQRGHINAADYDHFRRNRGSTAHPDWKVTHARAACNGSETQSTLYGNV